MHPDPLRPFAIQQQGLASREQLLDAALSPWHIRQAVAGLRAMFPGVYLTGWGPVSRYLFWWAATLTTPRTVLSHTSAGAFWGIAKEAGLWVTVTRPGTRGTSRHRNLLVHYSAALTGQVVDIDGLRVTSPERTIIDIWPLVTVREREKMLREALRKRVTSVPKLLLALRAHRGRRGLRSLRATVRRWSRLPFHRCRSDAEAYALVILDEAGVREPLVNAIVAGEEADFSWPQPDVMRIIEIDGPQWHLFKEEDARKTAIWTAAGFRVRRLPSDELFADPSLLLALAPPAQRTSGR